MKDVFAVLLAAIALAVALTVATWVAPIVRLEWWHFAAGAWLLAVALAWSFVLAAGRWE